MNNVEALTYDMRLESDHTLTGQHLAGWALLRLEIARKLDREGF